MRLQMGKAARAARVSVVLVFAFSGLHSTKRGPLQAAVTYSSKGEALSDGKQTAARTTRDRSGVHLVRAEPTCTRKPRMIKCPQRGVDDDATPAEWRNGRRSGLKIQWGATPVRVRLPPRLLNYPSSNDLRFPFEELTI